MNGESEKPENGAYNPASKEHLLCAFVENWYAPHGRGGDGSTWRCGMMVTALSYLMTLNETLHEVIEGTCNGDAHVWIQVPKDTFKEGETPFEIYDPSRKQYGWPDKELKYEAAKKWPGVRFEGLAYKADAPGYSVPSVDRTATGVCLALVLADGVPVQEVNLSVAEALKLSDQIFNLLGKKSPSARPASGPDKEEKDPEQRQWESKQALEDKLRGPRRELKLWSERLNDHKLPLDWRGRAAVEVGKYANLIAKIENEHEEAQNGV